MSANHPSAEELLQHSREKSASLEAHVRRCGACRTEVARLRKTLLAARAELLAIGRAAGPPAWLAKRSLERVLAQARYERARDSARTSEPWWRRLVPQLAATGALATAALVAAMLLKPAAADATRWAAVRGARTAADAAPAAARTVHTTQKIGNHFVLALGRAVELTLGF